MDPKAFDTFSLNDNKYQLTVENYIPTDPTEPFSGLIDEEVTTVAESLDQLRKEWRSSGSFQIHICTWDYLAKSDVKRLLDLTGSKPIRVYIQKKLRKKVKGMPRVVYRELMYTVTKFCKKSTFNVEQSAAVLSQFYLTHAYFVSTADVGAQKLYEFFKNLQLCHSLPFPPEYIKLFSLSEAKNVMSYFCRLYLRNLPIIKLASLPNFTLKVDYHIEPEKPIGKKGKKSKKDKKEGKGKKKNKKK